MGRRDHTLTEWSDAKKLTVLVEKPKPSLTLDIERGVGTLTCSVKDPADWEYDWFKHTSDSSIARPIRGVVPDKVISVSEAGLYHCRGGRGDPRIFTEDSNTVAIQQTFHNRPTVTLRPKRLQIYSSEKITLRCDIQGGGGTDWTYEWKTPSPNTLTRKEYIIDSATESQSGEYSCRGRRDYILTEWSDNKTLTVIANKPKAVLRADNRDIPLRGSVTLTCSVNPPSSSSSSSGWKYYFWYSGETSSETMTTQGDQFSVSQGGLYRCRGGRGEPVYYTDSSDSIRITENIPIKATVTLQPNWPQIYSSEKITLRCAIQGGGNTGWTYEWRTPSPNTPTRDEEYIISRATESHSGEYHCMGRRDHSLTQWSDAKTLTVLANKPKAVLRADNRDIPVGGSVTLTCSVNPSSSSSGWKYFLYRGETSSKPLTTQSDQFRVSQGGVYWCRGGRGWPLYYTDYSDPVHLTKNIPNKATVTLQPNWLQIYSSEKIILRCEIQGGGDTDWTYEWSTPSSNTRSTRKEYIISSATESHSGEYSCMGRRDHTLTEWSDAKKLTVLVEKPKPSLTLDIERGVGTLTCSVKDPADWEYDWFKHTSDSSIARPIRGVVPDKVISVSEAGLYHCRGGRGDPRIFTEDSNTVAIQQTFHNRPTVTLRPKRLQIYSSEKITLRCDIQGGGGTDWTYEWKTPSPNTLTRKEYIIDSATESQSGEYSCRGRRDYILTEWSDNKTLTVIANKPKAVLRADNRDIPLRGSVTLTCSVNPSSSSSGWKYFLYRGETSSNPLTTQSDQFRVSQGGLYWCRGGRGWPLYYTDYSDPVHLTKNIPNRPTVTLQPNWSLIYSSEKITLRCAIQGDGDTGWTYEWSTSSPNTPTRDEEYIISSATESHSGEYRCMGRSDYSLTQWSYTKKLTVLTYKPKAVLRADNRDIPVGSRVTLTCSVNPSSSSSGWKYYYWYRGETSSETMTTQSDQFRVSQGGLYRCRGGRGEPVYYTDYSDSIHITKNIPNRPTVTLQPNWPLIYRSEKITLRCEIQGGGGTGWTYEWKTSSPNTPTTHEEYIISSATESQSGEYSCMGRRGYSLTQWSDAKTLTVIAYKPKAVLRSDSRDIPVGGSVTLTCSVDPPPPSSSSGWKYFWYRGETSSETMTTQVDQFRVSQGGLYWCRGGRGGPVYYTDYSDSIHITKNIPNRPTVTLQPNWPLIYRSEKITLRCAIQGGGDTDWTYEWSTSSPNTPTRDEEYIISRATESHSGEYHCMGRRDYSLTQWSDAKTLTVIAYKPKAVLRSDSRDIPVGGSVTLTCSVDPPPPSSSSGWKYFWYRGETSSETMTTQVDQFRVSQGGLYWCRGGRGGPVYYTDYSDSIHITKNIPNRPTVTLQPNWPLIYRSEKITLRCAIQGGGDTDWTYEWSTSSPNTPTRDEEYIISRATESHSGEYHCMGRRDYSLTQWSDAKTLTVIAYKPKPVLRADNRDIPVGGSVTLTCSVNPSSSSSASPSSSSGWKYFWYRGNKTSEPLTTQDDDLLSNGQIRVPQRGLYWCRGGRGDPVYYTEYSDPVVTNRAVVIPQPNWAEIYSGETITFTCEIEDGGDAEWEYEWLTPDSYTSQNPSEHMIRPSHSRDYRCKGTMKSEKSSTEWSNTFTLRVSSSKPQPVLTVSPLWLSPGDSVTLNCSVTHPSAGWRFYWYNAVPKPVDNTYSYELLPGSINGTEQDSYIVHGQTHTAGYVCRAGRGDPVFHSDYSEPKFVWSGDFHSAASLTVSPDRVQHFDNELVSLSCEGDSTKWRVMRLSESGSLVDCTILGTMTGSTCNINHSWLSGVYWCESETGQFSNAVNITIQYQDIILVSPVHPVAEGHPVTLGCRLKTEKVLHDVDFYKNEKLIKNHTNGELIITAVSKSDEGFYRCKGKESPPGRRSWTSKESWMSVKHVPASGPEKSSPFPVLLIVGLVCGVSLIILLLLFLYRYRKSKDSCFMRSQNTSQGPATDHMINQDETQNGEYASALHGPARLYETIKGAAEPEIDESGDVTYSVVELKNIAKKGKNEPEESTVYSKVKMASAADDNVMYAQVHSHTKVKKDKGKSSPAEAEEAVYSEVKPGTSRDQ
ncbi:uncharacterized protein LOC119481336 [Sebastes umbrosus]|uniref:uncharacterized protein LOC119481336 n=1 Tax=Sebastes umbrosus TaxID=72105 RepID=UPI00189EEA42|nr:uncharacterized protein LOC119481336 [Sebastes umbrosus]